MFRAFLLFALSVCVAASAIGQTFPLADTAPHPLSESFNSASARNWRIVRLMAELSYLAYEDSIPTVQNRMKLNGFELASFSTVENQHYVSAWDAKHRTLVIAFRGTDVSQMADIWTDLDYSTRATDIGNVHQGFFLAQNALRGAIDWEIRRKQPKQIWVTGHSLGGAMAIICAAELSKSGKPLSGVVTFGQPRVGDRAFAERINNEFGSRLLRVINEDDIVVSLPPRLPTVPKYYISGTAIQFLNGQLETTGGIRVMAKPPISEIDDLFGSAPSARYQPPIGADLETEPDQLTKEEFQTLKEQLKQDPKMDEPKNYGAPGAVGGLFDSLDFKRRAGHHPMIEYIKQIERFESKEVGR